MIGWEQTSPTSYHRTWINPAGQQHVIVVAYVNDGWMFKWQRGIGLTVEERGGYLTLEGCMEALWVSLFTMHDRYHDLLVADARRIVRAQ